MKRYIAILFFLLSACAERSFPVLVEGSDQIGVANVVFAVTTRAEDAKVFFGVDRSETVSFGRYVVSVPPDRKPGDIRFPRRTPDPTRDFVLAGVDHFLDNRAFQSSLRREFSKLPKQDREATIYVHGFNNTFADSIFRNAQMKNDLGIPGVPISFSWASSANPLGYAYDSDSILIARDALEKMILDVRQSGAEQIIIVAHSMGAFLTMETLRQMAIGSGRHPSDIIDGVILISPDIDVDVFRSQAKRIGELPEPFAIFISERDRALRLSARLTGLTSRLGNLVDVERVSEFNVTLIDVTAFSDGDELNHFTVANSPSLLALVSRVSEIDRAFNSDASVRSGLLPGTVLTVQNTTKIILSPTQNIQR
ncbi:alpha/beta hydrolase [Parasulfitobacter algicola]|uniref:Alpha/beta hydrolase n=1 Tax=Parasulfitobacter algicola TaxID=2614809 RepID=A0ABX2IR74_9RHOB|nr:alpha/beta hydrolase [Sulfitobacter algicola]NSX53590.1 alpha/beta hydrolase [Sulfitobacter algicola]